MCRRANISPPIPRHAAKNLPASQPTSVQASEKILLRNARTLRLDIERLGNINPALRARAISALRRRCVQILGARRLAVQALARLLPPRQRHRAAIVRMAAGPRAESLD